jgi:hypothetical protein
MKRIAKGAKKKKKEEAAAEVPASFAPVAAAFAEDRASSSRSYRKPG